MVYEKQKFVDGQVLTADHLNYMEEGISELAKYTVPPCSNSDYGKFLCLTKDGMIWKEIDLSVITELQNQNHALEYRLDAIESIIASPASYFTTDGAGTITGLTDEGNAADKIVIPSEIDGVKITIIGDSAFYECTSLTNVIIPNGVTSIGDSAFHKCNNLTSIIIPSSIVNIGKGIFYGCTSLTSITIPNGVTSIGEGAFSSCRNLTSITIPDSVTSIGDSAFGGCRNLTSITIPDSVTSIGRYAFYECTNLTSITIGNGVTSIGIEAFYNTPWLENKRNENPLVIINDILIDGVSYANSELVIPDSVTIIGDSAFYECTNLTSITIGNSVTSIGGGAFEFCTSLTSITIGNGVTSIGKYAFCDCESLTTVYYTGAEEEWNAISIDDDDNDSLLNANKVFNYKG